MKVHDEIDDWMAGALCDALTPDETADFQRHLAACPHCKSLYEETQKMNNILSATISEARPDANFERRLIIAFREKSARAGFHPLRWAAWLVQFRPAQAAFAIILLCAMVKLGSTLTGERLPSHAQPGGGLAVNFGLSTDAPQMQNLFSNPNHQEHEYDNYFAYYKTGDAQNLHALGWNNNATNLGDTPIAGKRYYLGTTRNGTGSLALTGGNTYTGGTTITSGNLSLGAGTINTIAGVGTVADSSGNLGLNKSNAGFSKDGSESKYQIYADVATTGVNDKNEATESGFINYGYPITAQNIGTGTNPDAQKTVFKKIAKSNIPAVNQITTGLRSGSQAISANAIDSLITGTTGKASTSALAGDIPADGRVFAENGKFVQAGKLIKDHHEQSNQTTGSSDQVADSRKLIRNASMEIEVEKFDDSIATITKIAEEEQGYIATQNSDRGANGKLQGQIVVKVLPSNLDRFILKLRALGDLKNQTIGTQDVTKDYFDTESRIRNSKRTEEQLLEILKKNTNRVSELLQVEKELARVRESIEQMQGQLKFYDAMVQYATVTIALSEKDMNQPAAYLLKERANLSIFAKDVEKAFAEARSDAETAKAQIVESHVERDAENHVSATLRLLLPPDISSDTIARLKSLGRIQNYNAQTERLANSGAQDGTGDTTIAKEKREKVELNMTIQRDEETAAQQTTLAILTDHVEEKTADIKQAAASVGIDVKNAEFNHTNNGMEVSNLSFRMPLAKYPAFIEKVRALGKVKDFTVNRHEGTATENAPAEIILQIFSRPDIVTDDTGVLATIRHTFAQGFSALMWSARMIGVSLAFLAPWAVSLGLVIWLVMRRRGAKITKASAGK